MHYSPRWLARKRQRIDSETSGGSPADEHNDDKTAMETEFAVHADEAGDGEGAIVRHQKYLTSSQLLRLQLRDPSLRCHFLMQILVVFSYLINRKEKEVSDTKKEQICTLKRRVEDCVMLIPPSGIERIQLLLHLFDKSEMYWRNWKEDKCKSFETYDAGPNAAGSGKRKRPVKGASSYDTSASRYDEHHWNGDLDKLPRDVTHCLPKKEDFFEEYVQACDPENGIEEEYHPKNNPIFCWRGLRILSAHNLDSFDLVNTKTGDFERVVRAIWEKEMGVVIPGGHAQEEEPRATEEEHKGSDEDDEAGDVENEEETIPMNVEFNSVPVAEIVDDPLDTIHSYSNVALEENVTDENMLERQDIAQPSTSEEEEHEPKLTSPTEQTDGAESRSYILKNPPEKATKTEANSVKLSESNRTLNDDSSTKLKLSKEVSKRDATLDSASKETSTLKHEEPKGDKKEQEHLSMHPDASDAKGDHEEASEEVEEGEETPIEQKEEDKDKGQSRQIEINPSSKSCAPQRKDGNMNDSFDPHRRQDSRGDPRSHQHVSHGRYRGSNRGREHLEKRGGRDQQQDNYGNRRPGAGSQHGIGGGGVAGGGGNRPRGRHHGGGRR